MAATIRGTSAGRRVGPRGVVSWSSAVDGMTALVFGVVSLGCFTLMVVPALAEPAGARPAVALVLVLYLAAQVLSVKDLAAHGKERARFLPGVLALSLSAVAVASETFGPSPGSSGWWPLTILTTLGIYLIAVTYASRVGWIATLLAAGGVLLAVYVTVPVDAEEQLRRGLSQLVVLAGVLATTDLWARGLRRVAVESDRIEAQRLADLRTTSRAGREAVRLRDVERYIHDEVLHTLRAVAMDRSDLPAAKVRPMVDRLADELSPLALQAWVEADREATPGPAPAPAAHADLVAGLVRLDPPLDVTWDMPRTLALPSEVTAAFVAATVEALRNVVRHAGVPSAVVSARRSGTDVVVTVRDEGVGFDPTEPRMTRHGVARSVVQRMTDVGGTARLDSTPGGGTTVVLRWEPKVPRVGGRSFPWNDSTVRDVVTEFLRVPVPSVVAAVALTFLALPLTERPLLALAGLAAIVFVTMRLPRLASRAGMGPVAATAVQVLAVLAVVAIGFSVEHGSADPSELGALPYASLIPVVLLFSRPLWEGMLSWLLLTVAALFVCLVHVGRPEDLVLLWGVVVSPGVAMTAAIALRFALDRIGRSTFYALDARARAQGEADRTRTVRAQVAQRLDRVHAAARSFLDDLASGTLDVEDPAVRARADELEQAVREDLSLGPAPGVRGAVADLRARGVSVELRVPPQPPAEVDDAVAACVSALLSRARTRDGPLTIGAFEPMEDNGVVVTSVAVTVTPREDAWTVALLARTTETDAPALASVWRSALSGVDANVMVLDSDVRVRALVRVTGPAPRPQEGNHP